MENCIEEVLEKIHSPRDLKALSLEDLERLAKEIRDFLIANVPRTGGHFASNLGSVVAGLDRLLRLHLSSRGLK